MYLQATGKQSLPASWTKQSSTGTAHLFQTNGYVNGHQNGLTNGHVSVPLTRAYLEGKAVRTVYGLVPLQQALHWPVFASYDELAGCARWMGGRIPTLEEARSIYSYVENIKLEEAEQQLSNSIPAVNG